MANQVAVVLKLKDEYSNKLKSGTNAAAVGIAAMGAAAIAAAAGVVKLVNDVADYNDTIGKAAPATGLGVEQLSGLKHALEQAGGGANSATKAMETFAVKTGRAKDNFGTAKKAYATLGIELKKSNGTYKNQSELLVEVSDGLRDMEDGSKKTLVATQLFSKEAKTMINATKDGADGLKNMANEARSMGLIVTEEQARTSAAFNDMKDNLQKTIFGTFKNFADEIMPEVLAAVIMVRDAFADMSGDVDDNNSAVKQVGNTIKAILVPAVAGAIGIIKLLGGYFNALGQYVAGQFTVAMAIPQIIFEGIKTTVMGLIGSIGGLGKAFLQLTQRDWKGAAETGKKVFEKFTGGFGDNTKLQQAIAQAGIGFGDMFDAVTDGIDLPGKLIAEVKVAVEKSREEAAKLIKEQKDKKDKKPKVPEVPEEDPAIENAKKVYAALDAMNLENKIKKEESDMDSEEKEIAAAERRTKRLMELAGSDGDLKKELTEATEAEINLIKEKYREADEEAEMEKAKRLEASRQALMQQNQDIIKSSLVQHLKMNADGIKDDKKRAKAQKLITIGQILLSGAQGIARANKDYMWPASLAPMAYVAASTAAQVSVAARQKFAYGGIVEGTETSGDRIPIRANAGEAVLTTGDQKEFLDLARGKKASGGGASYSFNPTLNIQSDDDAPNVRRMLTEAQAEFKSFIHTTLREDTNVPRFRGALA